MNELAGGQKWFTWGRYEISRGLIKPVPKQKKPKFYRPMDFFVPPRGKRDSESLYLRFANVNPNEKESILAFVCRFGLLGLQEERRQFADETEGDNPEEENPRYNTGYISGSWERPESLEQFKEEARKFQHLLRLAGAVKTEDYNVLKQLAAGIGGRQKDNRK